MFDIELLLVTVQQLFVTSTPFSCRGETSTDNVTFEKQFAEKKNNNFNPPFIIQF